MFRRREQEVGAGVKNRVFRGTMFFVLAAELAVLVLFAVWDGSGEQDTVLVNDAVHSIQADWGRLEEHQRIEGLDYVVIDRDGGVLYRTGEGLSESINAAVAHRDTILDIRADGTAVGKIIILNDSEGNLRMRKQATVLFAAAAIVVQCIVCAGYGHYLNRRVIRPFRKLERFAERVAGGNLDLPLEMDRRNIFGAFTESFDLMRSELKKARRAEAEANAAKKELVAKLSHDIKTPVASIKAASEVGAALAQEEKVRENYMQIIRKADQLDGLISNLFSAALEELRQLPVTPGDMESRELGELLENADYLHRAAVSAVPDCILYADRLRLQQVFDNLFANSYKYAGTGIVVTFYREENRLAVCVEDRGGGVGEEELPFLKEKYMRGRNAEGLEGAGLGLFISDFFLREMQGELLLENGKEGLKATVFVPLSGK